MTLPVRSETSYPVGHPPLGQPCMPGCRVWAFSQQCLHSVYDPDVADLPWGSFSPHPIPALKPWGATSTSLDKKWRFYPEFSGALEEESCCPPQSRMLNKIPFDFPISSPSPWFHQPTTLLALFFFLFLLLSCAPPFWEKEGKARR